MKSEAKKDKYGWHVMYGNFRAAMPDEQTAKSAAVAPELLDTLNYVAGYFTAMSHEKDVKHCGLKEILAMVEEAIALAEGGAK